ncbi:ferritin-like domain-containing protein [Sphingobacterium hungaricum]|uniref:Aldehyde dehydrogenase n=1 Tax=Sphingobacterium hungaricum TaxID=2082723 RepID=A0A928YT83_9SPHI|nr:PA2169 family four-helix-bundle protein [Sphingobacterium hungaricum]MBE8714928.1 aldehyde dehydrogenase [Sphingobacterium hungaricum]
MGLQEKTNSILNDLIEINNDRVAGFEKAIEDIDDANLDLKVLFEAYILQSKKYAVELSAIVLKHGGNPEDGTSVSGGLHRAWIDVKALFGGSDRKSILSEAERGEDAIKKAYKEAIESPEIAQEVLPTLLDQSKGIQDSHDKIKALRDSA